MLTSLKCLILLVLHTTLLLLVSGCNQSTANTVLNGGQAADLAFIQGYNSARTRALQKTPLAIVALNNELIVLRDGVTVLQASVSSDIYTALRDVSHVVLGIWLVVWDAEIAEARRQSEAYASRIDFIESSMADSVIPPGQRARQERLLEMSRKLIAMAAKPGVVSQEQLEKWAASVKPDLLINVQEAAQAQLDTINQQMKRLVIGMTDKERSELIVVVCGVHQARQGNLQMQYFTALLGSEAVTHERRLLFAESIDDLNGALNLLGSHQLDRAISESFFGIPYRMQRDLLDDAALRIIPGLDLPTGMKKVTVSIGDGLLADE